MQSDASESDFEVLDSFPEVCGSLYLYDLSLSSSSEAESVSEHLRSVNG